jgi:flavin-dependent dehydrogenase
LSTTYDVIIIGAGPAGSCAAALLADQGHKVLIIEREVFPRFHIGESLLPACIPALERMGIEVDPEIYVIKDGAHFLCEATDRGQKFSFSEAFPELPRFAWHVDRAKFDTQLRDRAVELGAEVRHGQTVNRVGVGEDSVWAETDAGREKARFLLDSSGQKRFLARREKSMEPITQFGETAVFTHFEDVSEGAYNSLGPGFEIRIVIQTRGWGWIIPLPGRRLSVGVAGPGKLTVSDLDEGLLSGPLMTRLANGARRLKSHITSNFSYRNSAAYGPRYATIGDANSFLDPVFSSGVTVALRAALDLADTLGPALKAGTEGQPDLLARHQADMKRAIDTFYALIHRFYHTNFVNSFFLSEAPDHNLRSQIMTVLAGHVWVSNNPFQELLLTSQLRERRKPTGMGS